MLAWWIPPDTRGAVRVFLGILFCVRDEVLHGFPRAVGPHIEPDTLDHQADDGIEVGDGIERQVLEVGYGDRLAATRHENRIAIRLGVVDILRTDDSGGSRLVVDDQGLPDVLRGHIGDGPGDHVGPAAGGESNHHLYRFTGILLCPYRY